MTLNGVNRIRTIRLDKPATAWTTTKAIDLISVDLSWFESLPLGRS
jgi:hypothetical protein